MRTALTFEDVLLVPQYSDIPSRADIDLSTRFLGMDFKLPIISANMDYVTEYAMATAMYDNGGFYIHHRFLSDYDLYKTFDSDLGTFPISVSVGVRDPEQELGKVQYLALEWGRGYDHIVVTVDVAHGHHARVADMINRLREIGVQRIIAGNVATAEGYRFLAQAGADAVKVGIGPGSVCTTREVAGVGVPQISALMDIARLRAEEPLNLSATGELNPYGPPVIADGGMKSSGDIVKALAAGANMVMLGSLLAGTKEAPGERRVGLDGRTYKRYRGQSIFGVNASHYTPEGIEGWVEEKEDVATVLARLGAGIRSGLSYIGARNLTELREKAEFVQITQAGYMIEGATRVINEL